MEEKELKKAYQEKGFQKVTLKEYQEQKNKKETKKKITIPVYVKFILGAPFMIICCFGIFFIPYTLYIIATSPQVPIEEPAKSDVLKR